MSFTDSKPIYLQIADRICDDIMIGTYGEGERIPSVREYAQLIEVSANTVARTFEYLQNQGIIYNRRGVGLFVEEQAAQAIKRIRHKAFIDTELEPFMRKAAMLDIADDELLEAYHRQREALRSQQRDDG
ncbi:MAG: GntR family transcriptional regulator [Muribaculaceae bacterium]